MKNPSCLIIGISLFLNLVVSAQPVVIKANVTKGCDSLSVHFTFEPNFSTVTSVKWDFGGGVTSTSNELTVSYSSPGSYSVKLVINGTDSLTEPDFIQIGRCDSIEVPNVFTPNDDGFNDDFRVSSSGKSVLKLRIFTSTGIMVYKTDAKILKWDGRLPSGEKVSPGIYFYIIETVDDTPAIRKSGYFYLYR
jgi:gliding motility-associated-like protein